MFSSKQNLPSNHTTQMNKLAAAHLTPQRPISFPYYSCTSSEISNIQKDCLLYSTDEQESTKGVSEAIEEISIYGQRFQIDLKKEDSISSFLHEIERKKNINCLTKASIKILVLKRAVSWKKELRHLLHQTYEAYQNMVLKSIIL